MKNTLEDIFLSYGFTTLEYKYIRSSGLAMLIPDKTIEYNLEENFAYFKSLEFDDKKIRTFFKINPKIITINKDKIVDNLYNLYSFNYTKSDTIKMIKTDAKVITLTKNEITTRISALNIIGYKYEDIIHIGKHTPQIFTDDMKNINDKLAFLMDLGYAKEEVIYMTKSLSSLFVYSYDNIQSKIDFLDSLNAHYLPVIKPNILMQNANVSYARLKYYEDHNIDYKKNDYKKIFIGEKQFVSQYKITKDELLEKYIKETDKQKKY